jgi:hypothetical protein
VSDGLLPSKPSAKFLDYVGLGLILMPIEGLGARWLDGQPISFHQWLGAAVFMFAGAIAILIGTWWDKVTLPPGRLAASLDAVVHNAITWLLASALILFGIPTAMWLLSSDRSDIREPPNAVSPIAQNTPSKEISVSTSPHVSRSKTTITELMNESESLLNVIEKSGMPIANDWRNNLLTVNPERICFDLDVNKLRATVADLSGKLRVAQNDINKILETNRIDYSELWPLLNDNPASHILQFDKAANRLDYYKNALTAFDGKPSCEDILKSDLATNAPVQMNIGFEEFSNWVPEAVERLQSYRENLRQELRNVP